MEYHTMSEETSISLLCEGDEDAFHEIYQRYHKLVYFVANKTCHNEADAKDVMQETFLTIHEHIKDVRNPKYFRLWVYRIISSKCKKMFHKNKRTMYVSDEAFYEQQLEEKRNYLIPHASSRKQSDLDVLNDMIDTLSPGQRLVVIMFYMEQFTIHEISEILDIPDGTVKSRLSIARKHLQKQIDAYQTEHGASIDFKSLDTLLPLAFASAVSNCVELRTPIIVTFVSKIKKMMSTSSFHTAVTIVSIGTVIVGSASLYKMMNPSSQIGSVPSDQKPYHLANPMNHVDVFEPVLLGTSMKPQSRKSMWM